MDQWRIKNGIVGIHSRVGDVILTVIDSMRLERLRAHPYRIVNEFVVFRRQPCVVDVEREEALSTVRWVCRRSRIVGEERGEKRFYVIRNEKHRIRKAFSPMLEWNDQQLVTGNGNETIRSRSTR